MSRISKYVSDREFKAFFEFTESLLTSATLYMIWVHLQEEPSSHIFWCSYGLHFLCANCDAINWAKEIRAVLFYCLIQTRIFGKFTPGRIKHRSMWLKMMFRKSEDLLYYLVIQSLRILTSTNPRPNSIFRQLPV